MPSLIRVLLADLPVVLREVLSQQLMQQDDIQVVGHSQGNLDTLLQAQAGVDVIILGVSRLKPPPSVCGHLLNEFPHVRILVYSLEQGSMVGYWLGVRQCRVRQVDRAGLVEGIRTLFNYTATV